MVSKRVIRLLERKSGERGAGEAFIKPRPLYPYNHIINNWLRENGRAENIDSIQTNLAFYGGRERNKADCQVEARTKLKNAGTPKLPAKGNKFSLTRRSNLVIRELIGAFNALSTWIENELPYWARTRFLDRTAP